MVLGSLSETHLRKSIVSVEITTAKSDAAVTFIQGTLPSLLMAFIPIRVELRLLCRFYHLARVTSSRFCTENEKREIEFICHEWE